MGTLISLVAHGDKSDKMRHFVPELLTMVAYYFPPGLRLITGRSSSFFSSGFLLSPAVRRRVVSLPSLPSLGSLCFMISASRFLAISKSELSTMYWSRGGRMLLISCCVLATRAGGLGWSP